MQYEYVRSCSTPSFSSPANSSHTEIHRFYRVTQLAGSAQLVADRCACKIYTLDKISSANNNRRVQKLQPRQRENRQLIVTNIDHLRNRTARRTLTRTARWMINAFRVQWKGRSVLGWQRRNFFRSISTISLRIWAVYVCLSAVVSCEQLNHWDFNVHFVLSYVCLVFCF